MSLVDLMTPDSSVFDAVESSLHVFFLGPDEADRDDRDEA
jgi:hypothetical protein